MSIFTSLSRGATLTPAAVACLTAALLLGSHQYAAAEPQTVPFAKLAMSGVGASVQIHDNGSSFRMLVEGIATLLPPDVVPQAILSFGGDGRAVLGRRALSGEVQAFDVSGSMATQIAIAPDLRGRLLLFHAFPAFGANIVVAYDVEETFASGRSGSVVRDGMDVFRLDIANGVAKFKKLVDKSPIGGIDSAFRDIAIPGGHLVCGQSSCIRFKQEDGVIAVDGDPITPKSWVGFAQVELFLRAGEPRALLRRDDDDRVTAPPAPDTIVYRDCPILREEGCIDLPNEKVPSGIDDAGRVRFIESCGDVAATLERDLTRLPNGGLTFVAVNNHEGRIPWGQVYVLDGLLDVVEGLALRGRSFDALREAMRRRVVLEVEQWSRLAGADQPWLWSRRYSLGRNDIVSVLHLARMARVSARIAMNDRSAAAILAPLHRTLARELSEFTTVVEQPRGRELYFKKGAWFWFDGGNAPWNYQSAWIDGIAAIHRLDASMAAARPLARILVEEFVAVEIAPTRPNTWRYCAGICQTGWRAEDDVSINTPNWEGNKTRTESAHVSYRAMDVRAVLEAMRIWRLPDLDWFPAYVRDLVQRGWLYPMVGAPLATHGITPTLSTALIGRYGRAAIPFDIHNQVWALDQLARNLGCASAR